MKRVTQIVKRCRGIDFMKIVTMLSHTGCRKLKQVSQNAIRTTFQYALKRSILRRVRKRKSYIRFCKENTTDPFVRRRYAGVVDEIKIANEPFNVIQFTGLKDQGGWNLPGAF